MLEPGDHLHHPGDLPLADQQSCHSVDIGSPIGHDLLRAHVWQLVSLCLATRLQ